MTTDNSQQRVEREGSGERERGEAKRGEREKGRERVGESVKEHEMYVCMTGRRQSGDSHRRRRKSSGLE